jgi:hypothetical protein
MNLPEYTKWELAMFCKSCNEHLTHRQFHDNHGVCVHCGAVSPVLPDVTNKARRKRYTDGRQLAIKAQKSRKSNVIVRLFAHLFSNFRKEKARPFVWEYKEKGIPEFNFD